MDAQRDVKPFSVVAMAGMEGGLHGANTSLSMALQLGCGDTRGPPPHLQAACVLNRASSDLSEVGGDMSYHDEGLKHISAPSCSAPRTCRNFWSAGDYDVEAGLSTRQLQSVQNRMCVHPKFLHSNATSHKWPFGAVAELLDNAVDEIQTGGATRIKVDKIIDHRNGSPALLVQESIISDYHSDDGGGMDPDSIRCCMSFGFSDKQSGSSIGQCKSMQLKGNGFKTSTMRLGADAIVFSRSTKSGEPTQSIGLLSYTFLVETGQKDVVVPVFTNIGPHGTKIIVFNLWSNDDGNLELDFDTNPEDIMIRGAPNLEEINNSVKRVNENHLANRLRYSLRVYTSILYLQLPEYFKIILRGKEVVRHCVVADLIYILNASVIDPKSAEERRFVLEKHYFFSFTKFFQPFHQVLSTASSKGKGVSGVLEADFIKPTHDKQDFEKSQLYQKLINRLKDMTKEYWDIHCHKVGYSKPQRSREPLSLLLPSAMLPATRWSCRPDLASLGARSWPRLRLDPRARRAPSALLTGCLRLPASFAVLAQFLFITAIPPHPEQRLRRLHSDRRSGSASSPTQFPLPPRSSLLTPLHRYCRLHRRPPLYAFQAGLHRLLARRSLPPILPRLLRTFLWVSHPHARLPPRLRPRRPLPPIIFVPKRRDTSAPPSLSFPSSSSSSSRLPGIHVYIRAMAPRQRHLRARAASVSSPPMAKSRQLLQATGNRPPTLSISYFALWRRHLVLSGRRVKGRAEEGELRARPSGRLLGAPCWCASCLRQPAGPARAERLSNACKAFHNQAD
ncbi:hypothetical protein PR202_gb04508 [Eleusine coracana subsp. coracana]|uniref:Morc S5 domain-containing protein n=1 Tax=Eleusine coracana subsp. coracana TaxID=191504 RepID=A0AAV5E2B5_ELECO|nr:hypothetical protein PR202_gb04508 [Eleusine coracana subsp. coracana]